jgi:hypothetical protein
MAHLGERLRQQRLAQCVELSRIAEETRIGLRYLEALEKGDWKQLPGSIFARSFARQYARFVGLDESSIENEVQSLFQIEDKPPEMEAPPQKVGFQLPPIGEIIRRLELPFGNGVPRPMLSLVAVLALCSAVYVGWQKIVLGGSGAGQQQAADPAVNVPAIKLPAGAAPARPVENASLTQEGSNSAAGSGESIVELRVPEGSTNGMAVQIVASQDTWVQITANGKKVFSGTLRANEARKIVGVATAKMVIGNAGGVEVQTDGRSIGPIGPVGQVRVVMLSPEGPKIMKKKDGANPEDGSRSSRT